MNGIDNRRSRTEHQPTQAGKRPFVSWRGGLRVMVQGVNCEVAGPGLAEPMRWVCRSGNPVRAALDVAEQLSQLRRVC